MLCSMWLDLLADKVDELSRWQPPIKWSRFEEWAKGVRPFFVERLREHLEEFDKLTARPKVHMLPRSGPMKPSGDIQRLFGPSHMDRYRQEKAEADARSRESSATEQRWFQQGVDSAWRKTIAFIEGILMAKQDDEPFFGDDKAEPEKEAKHVFVAHGRSEQWELLSSFLHHGLGLDIEEFNLSESPAGKMNSEHVEDLLGRSDFAFLVYTAEDEQPDGTTRARENVIEETGRSMIKLGRKRAIILQEEGCNIPSNLDGVIPIRFPKGRIDRVFDQVKAVLAREGMV